MRSRGNRRPRPSLTRQLRQGFTLIELLVTLAIVGLLLAVLLNLQGSTISFTERQNGLAQRLQTINDVSGYIGDRVKAARLVPDNLTLPDGLTATSTSLCSRAGALPCLAVVLPVVDPTCGLVVHWRLHAFRYLRRSSIPAPEREPMPALDDPSAGAYGLREVRLASILPAGSCTAPMTTPPDITSFTGTKHSGMIVDNLLVPAGVRVFDYDAGTRIVTLRFQSVTAGRAALEYTPAAGPYELKVFARNVN